MYNSLCAWVSTANGLIVHYGWALWPRSYTDIVISQPPISFFSNNKSNQYSLINSKDCRQSPTISPKNSFLLLCLFNN